jgi:16S rRNA (guanine527-N7)-methyltransferase
LFHVKQASYEEGLALLGLSLGPDTIERLSTYEGLLAERGISAGLVARSDAHRIRERHVLDSLRAATAVRAGDTFAYDLGSGAGLPGIPVAIVVSELGVRLVESRRTRSAFLELAIERLELDNAEVILGRVESQSQPADLCLARAFAPLPEAWSLAGRLLRPGGRLVYFAGKGEEAPRMPRSDAVGASSITEVADPLFESGGSLIIMTR